MFIANISKFLVEYKDLKKSKFLEILNDSNAWFDLYKLEKDFLLTLILIKFWEKYPNLIFKWWTCLNKIYFPYFRMSEDLDFVIDEDLWRTARKTLLKKYENNFIEDLEILGLKLTNKRTKFDEHKLAIFNFEYKSVIDNSPQNIKIDISLKNKIYLPAQTWIIKSVFVDAVFEEKIFQDHIIKTMDLKEMLAEKLRAALTRKTPAIRDFFDIWYVKNNSDFDFEDKDFKKILKTKLEEVDFEYSLEQNFELLKKQIQTDLKPVLNKNYDFNFDEIYNFILGFKL